MDLYSFTHTKIIDNYPFIISDLSFLPIHCFHFWFSRIDQHASTDGIWTHTP